MVIEIPRLCGASVVFSCLCMYASPSQVGDRIWSYMYGTAAKQGSSSLNIDEEDSLSGYGVGLPCARLYARYLGGNLSLTSYPGYGTQAHLLLPRIDSEQVEEVPETSFHDPI